MRQNDENNHAADDGSHAAGKKRGQTNTSASFQTFGTTEPYIHHSDEYGSSYL